MPGAATTAFADEFASWQSQSRLLDHAQRAFVVGPQKTGTTWMGNVLSAHPQIGAVPSGIVSGLFRRLEAAMLEDMAEQYLRARWPLGKFSNKERRFFLRQIYDRVAIGALDLSEKSAPPVILEQEAGNTQYIPLLMDIFPNARFVCCTRDVRDAAVSAFHHFRVIGTISEQAVESYARRYAATVWAPAMRAIKEAEAQYGADRFFHAPYEDHKADAPAMTRRILDFLGVDSGDKAVEKCVHAGDFKRRSGGRDPGEAPREFHFYRKGVVGDWANHFSEDFGRELLQLASAEAETYPREHWLRECLWSAVEQRCRDHGAERVALFPAGAQTRSILRERWPSEAIDIVAALDDKPTQPEIAGVPVLAPSRLPEGAQAIVITSDLHGEALEKRARDLLRELGRDMPVLRMYDAARPMPV